MIRRKWVRYSVSSLAVVFLGSGYQYHKNHTLTSKLAAFTAELDATDPGWRFDDLLRDYESRIPPDDKNPFTVVKAAASKPLAASEKLLQQDNDWLPEFELNRRPRQGDLALVESVLHECRDAMEIARTLKDYPSQGGAKSEITIYSMSTPVKYLDQINKISILLANNSLVKCRNSEWTEVIDSLTCQMHLARSVGEDPFPATIWIRVFVFARAIDFLERSLALGEPESLEALLPLLQAEDEIPHLRILARGDRALMHRMFENLNSGQYNLENVIEGREQYRGALLIQLHCLLYQFRILHDHLEVLARTNQFVQIAEKPSHLRYAEVIALESTEPRAGFNKVLKKLYETGLKYKYMDIALFDLRFHTRLRCAQVAIRCEQYRQTHGSWPTNPDLPIDPYTGQPLRYRRYSGGVVIYSPGLDGKDNDGNLANIPGKDDPGTDVGFRLWDPDRRNLE